MTAPGRRRTAWEGNVDVVQVREGASVHPSNHRAQSTPLPAGEVGRSRSIRSTTRPRGSSGKPPGKFRSSSHNWGAHTWAMAHGASFLLFSFPFLFFPRRNSSLLFPLCVKHSSSQHNRSSTTSSYSMCSVSLYLSPLAPRAHVTESGPCRCDAVGRRLLLQVSSLRSARLTCRCHGVRGLCGRLRVRAPKDMGIFQHGNGRRHNPTTN